MLMCTCNWLNMKPSCYLLLDFSLGLLNLREIVGCKIVEVCHYRHKLPAVCLPSVFKELQLLKKKNQHPQYWRRAKAINVNSLRNCKPTFIAMTLFHIKRKTALQRLFSLSKNIRNIEVLANLANISCTYM